MTLEYGELGKFQLNNRVYNVKNKKIFIQRLDLELEHCGAAGGARTESYATRAHVEPAFSDGKLASTKDSGDRDRDGWTAPARAQIPKRRCLSATYVGRFFSFFSPLSSAGDWTRQKPAGRRRVDLPSGRGVAVLPACA
jgi:hypothetical protein